MAEATLEHRIRVDLGKAFHHKHRTGSGAVDIEQIATEHGVSEDQVKEQFNWLREQNLINGPLADEARQIEDVPASWYQDHEFTDEGLAWAEEGFPIRETA